MLLPVFFKLKTIQLQYISLSTCKSCYQSNTTTMTSILTSSGWPIGNPFETFLSGCFLVQGFPYPYSRVVFVLRAARHGLCNVCIKNVDNITNA